MLYLVSSTSSYNYNSLYGPCPQGICQLYFGGSGYKVQHLTNGRFKATDITKYIYVSGSSKIQTLLPSVKLEKNGVKDDAILLV